MSRKKELSSFFYYIILPLTLKTVHGNVLTMQTKTIKTDIKRLLSKYPEKSRYAEVHKLLGIGTRHIRYLESGERFPSDHLRKLVKLLLPTVKSIK